jgi:crotonobetainyl-CoA:carnitine CoA-transferase CaiB-like acyl-CoA transferase
MSTQAADLPLCGVRVADFSWIVAGPQATRILADLGAEVIRIENEGHLDSMRLSQSSNPNRPTVNGSGFFSNFNRNKLGITANLHHPAGREAVERLISVSDVVVENFSAGVFDRLGFAWERLQALNPRIIYLSLSGFGHSGRDASYVTWGPTAQAVSGATAISGLPDREPAGWGYSYLDHTAGYFGAIALLMALYRRDQTGEGQYIDLSQVETGMVLGGVAMLDYQVNDRHSERIGNHARYPAIAPHNTYPCNGEDRWIAVAVESDAQWLALCTVLGSDALENAPAYATNLGRLADQERLDARIAQETRRFDARELMYLLQARGVPAGTVQNARDKLEFDPQLAARGFYPTAPHPELGDHRFEGLPMRFSRARWQVRRGAPLLGEDTQRLLADLLGYDDAVLAEMVAEGAL